MPCSAISSIIGFNGLLVWPTSCEYFFYLYILEFVFAFLMWSTYKADEKRIGKADLLSSAAISSLILVFLGVVGTLIQDTNGVPMIQADILLIFIAQFIVLMVFWIFKKV